MKTEQLIREHHLQPHPEGGFYFETFRSSVKVRTAIGERAASTAIYFLLPRGTHSKFHRVLGDEVWHFYGGDPLELHLLDDRGHTLVVLDAGTPQAVVTSGVWQAARSRGDSFVGCTVAPGFEFADFEIGAQHTLLAQFPNERAIIEALT